MTKAKFKVPRCPEMFASKEYERCWRPSCHLVCAIAHGIVECYYVMNGDLKKDSNMNITLINRTIDIAMAVLQDRGVQPPEHLCLQADNTCREQRNQFLFTWCALSCAKGLWASVSPVFYIPGHTHNEVDQRFVPVAAALSRSPKLETCQECWLKTDVNQLLLWLIKVMFMYIRVQGAFIFIGKDCT